jgi:hypothetical protein
MNETFLNGPDETPVPPITEAPAATETQTPTVPAAPAAPAAPAVPVPSIDDLLKEDDLGFLRKFQSRVYGIFKNPLTGLTGSARLIAELLARSGKPIIPRSAMVEIVAWRDQWGPLQKCIDEHGDDYADAAWEKMEQELHLTAQSPDHVISNVILREDFHKKYERVRMACFDRQQALYREYIGTARAIAASVAEIIGTHAANLDKEEKRRYEQYGLPYAPGSSPLVIATKKAQAFAIARTAQTEGAAGPSQILPWMLL